MTTITEKHYESLVQKIYQTLMDMPYIDENRDVWVKGLGEIAETKEEAERIINEWLKESNIEII
jgi:hypothetical protein